MMLKNAPIVQFNDKRRLEALRFQAEIEADIRRNQNHREDSRGMAEFSSLASDASEEETLISREFRNVQADTELLQYRD
jgi:hypothetical protein